MNKAMIYRIVLVASLLLASIAAPAAEIQGVKFEDSIRLADTRLELNGVGLRGVVFIKGYVAGLYVPQKSADAEALIQQKGPKRMLLHMLRRAEAHDFIDAFDHGLRKNLKEDQLLFMAPRMEQLSRTMTEVGTVNKGDVVALDLGADGSTRIAINGAVRGSAIAGPDFYSAILRIFIGERPVDQGLKKGLLGPSA